MLRIKEVKINYESNPVGLWGNPQFGWVMESDQRNVVQRAYQLQIAKDDEFLEVVSDSGKVECSRSAQVTASPFQMLEATKYFVRVKVWSTAGESDWGMATFVTALASADSWQGEFVSAEEQGDKDNAKGTYVRGTFVVDKKVKEAYAFTTGLGIYEFYLNGEKVGEDLLTPGWTVYHKHLLYQTYDITKHLVEGENGMGASLGAGWFKGTMGFIPRRNIYGDHTAFLGQLVIRYVDGTEEIIVTDESWVGHESPVEFAEIYDGEIYNANKEIPGWANAPAPAGDWKPVRIIPYDKEALQPQSNCRVQKIDIMPAKRVFVTPSGDTVIDFGQNMSALIEVSATGKPGDVIEIWCFEELDKDGNVYLDNLRGAKQAMKYTFAEAKTSTYMPKFTFMGFRYAKIVSWPGAPKAEDFTAYAIHSYMEPTGTFECSNPDLNQLQSNILWSMKGNFVDIPTDCPQRNERMGWTGDAQIFIRTSAYLMNVYTFFDKWLTDVEKDQQPCGAVPQVVPDIITGYGGDNWLMSQGTYGATAWADVAVIAPWTLYLTYGDRAILAKQYNSMKGWIDFMVDHSDDYIWSFGLQCGDWVALDAQEGSYFGATPEDLLCTAYFAYSTGLFVKSLRVLGKEEEAKEYQELYENVVDKFKRTFFDENGDMTAQTQTSYIVALYFGLVPEGLEEQTIEGLKNLLAKEDGHLVTGFIGTPYFCHALSQNGALKEAYELLLKDDFPSWLYQVKRGATTIWEHWDGIKPDGSMWSADMNSFNHYAYGAVGEWLYRAVVGLEIDENEPGYKHTIIYPRIGGDLDYAKGTYQSIYGEVGVRWEVAGDTVKVKVTIPVNTTATIKLDTQQILEGDGLDFVSVEGQMVAKTGSGEYCLVMKK